MLQSYGGVTNVSRDPERIRPFLFILEALWEEHCPDLRFFQFVAALPSMLGLPEDSFYVEDDKTLEKIVKCLQEYS